MGEGSQDGDGSPLRRTHGGLVAEELEGAGLSGATILDFSVNLNPYGPAPAMIRALAAATVADYPDPTARVARAALAAAHDLPLDGLVLGPGAADLIWTAARALLDPGQTALEVAPTFGEFAAAVSAARARLTAWRASPETGFALDLSAVVAAARRSGAALLYLCTPGNPTGAATPSEALSALARALPTTRLLVDESFLSLSDHHADAATTLPDNVIRIRSLTKEQAIPGVRVGYLVARPALAARLEAARPTWSTGAHAQAAARASAGLGDFVAESRRRVLADGQATSEALATLGLRPLPSSTCYSLVPVPDAAALRTRLLRQHRILVRDCTSFGLPGHIRLAARPADQRRRLLTALRLCLSPSR